MKSLINWISGNTSYKYSLTTIATSFESAQQEVQNASCFPQFILIKSILLYLIIYFYHPFERQSIEFTFMNLFYLRYTK